MQPNTPPLDYWSYQKIVTDYLNEKNPNIPSNQTITTENIEKFWEIANSTREDWKHNELKKILNNTSTVKDIYILMIIYQPQNNRFRDQYIIQNSENNKNNIELLKNIINASALFIESAQSLCDFYKGMINNINLKSNNEETARKIENFLDNTESKNDKNQEVPELLKTILECTQTKYDAYKDINFEKFDEKKAKQDAEGLKDLLTRIRKKGLNKDEIIKEIYNKLINIMQRVGTMAATYSRMKTANTLNN